MWALPLEAKVGELRALSGVPVYVPGPIAYRALPQAVGFKLPLRDM